MKIVHYSHCNLGSAEASTAHVMEFADRLSRRGHDVHVVAPAKGRYRAATPCSMHYFAYVDIKGFRQITAVMSGFILLCILHALHRLDCIYIRNLAVDVMPAFFSRITGVPLIVETNGQAEIYEFEVPLHFLWRPFWLPVLKWIERELYKASSAVTADGQTRLGNFKRDYPESSSKMHLVRSGGIDLEKFRPVDKQQSRQRLDVPKDKRICIWVGTLFAWSGLEILFEAAPAIIKAHPDVFFLIVGDGGDGPRFRELAGEKGLSDYVRFTGYIETGELFRWLSASDVALAPYTRLRLDREDFTSYKIFEYLACGLPVVCSYESGESNIGYVKKYDFGETVPPEEPEAFGKAVIRVLGEQKYFSAEFAANVRKTLRSLDVTWENLVDQVEKLCVDAVQTGTRRRSHKDSGEKK